MTADVDFGEILDYLIYDSRTLHPDVRRRHPQRPPLHERPAFRRPHQADHPAQGRPPRSRAMAAATHSGMAAVSDTVFDAAVRRAGVVRVQNVGQLFYAAKALASKFRPLGNRLAIITNGGGPGAMAADRAGDLGIPLAELTNETMAVLNKAMPTNWSHANPIDIGGDATPERYRDAIMAVTHDPNVTARWSCSRRRR
jgi:acetyltransferase